MTKTNAKVDAFLSKKPKWHAEFTKLRAVLLAGGLDEDFKWGWPCYALDGKNVVLMHGFKDYCALLFVKGALMKDPKKILVQQTANVQGPRQVRFTSVKEIAALEATLKAYVREAAAVEKAGKKVPLKKPAEYPVPEEFQAKLDTLPALKCAFAELTPGRQRAYLLFFAGAKQSATRAARVAKCIPQILQGKGLDD